MKRTLTLLLPLLFLSAPLFGQENSAENIVKNLQYKTGTIRLKDDLATLTVPPGFKFLDAPQSQKVLTEVWGNPPSENTLGMLFLEKQNPVSEDFTYAVEISYSDEGHIEDDDATEIDYDDLLAEMKKDAKESNEYRKEKGYDTVELVGWAQKPFYDRESKKLHWAKNLKFEQTPVNTLNYNIRILGRRGYINLNIISDMPQLERVNRDLPAILASTEFNEGEQYSDFNPELDEVAAYGIGGLIAGKVLSKVGLFAIIAKFGKFIIAGLAAAAYAAKNFFFKGKKEAVAVSGPAPDEEGES